ncbi:hypothetical protein BC827DRAFT_1159552 [Russula dissimulans]|nr:hypothetical protein BC827DRAFT_1159552 [Russula dissimulans]
MDPKVLSSLECRAKQILIDAVGDEGDVMLKNSLTTIVDKANDALVALKTCKNAILLTFNNKEVASWIGEMGNELAFMDKFWCVTRQAAPCPTRTRGHACSTTTPSGVMVTPADVATQGSGVQCNRLPCVPPDHVVT